MTSTSTQPAVIAVGALAAGSRISRCQTCHVWPGVYRVTYADASSVRVCSECVTLNRP